MIKVYGPYTNKKNGRKHVIIVEAGIKRTQSYPRYLMEQHLGRRLEDWETVDHINEDFTDDEIGNLQLLTRPANAAKSMRLRRPRELYEFTCPTCGNWTSKPANKVRSNRKQGKAGPFCGKSCSRRHQINARVAERQTQPA